MSLRSPLGRVLGRGSAKEGVHEWWIQRVTAIALVPLTLWLFISLVSLPSLDYETITQWMSGVWTAVFLILTVIAAARHSQLGLRVIIEDYIHGSGAKTTALLVMTFVHVLVAAAAIFAILKVAFGSVE